MFQKRTEMIKLDRDMYICVLLILEFSFRSSANKPPSPLFDHFLPSVIAKSKEDPWIHYFITVGYHQVVPLCILGESLIK